MTETFTPVASLLGGVLVGLGASLLLFCNGRVAGVSGIVGGVLFPSRADLRWQGAFVLGLLAGGATMRIALPQAFAITVPEPGVLVVVAGLLVGFGTRLGGGCTSGHGVCGISRGSTRSVVATLAFMATGFLTVLLVRRTLGVG